MGDCCLKSFKEKQILLHLTTSEKTIQLTTALLHHFCDFFKTFELSQVEDRDTRRVLFMNPPGSVEGLKKLHFA